MNIACSIYVLIVVSFLCTASADESSAPRENGNLAKRVKVNARNIDAMERKILKSKAILESKVADLEGDDEVIDRKVMALRKKAKELNDIVVEFSGTVMDVNENIADLAVRIQNTTEDVNGAVLEIDGKVNDSIQDIADLDRQFKKTTEELNSNVLKLDEKCTNADVEVEGKVVEINEEIADLGGKLNATTDGLNDLDGVVTVLEEKIKFLNGDVLKFDEKFTNADVEVEEKVAEVNEEIADLGGKLNTTTDDLNGLDEAVTGLEEKIKLLEEADVEVEGKVSQLNEEVADLGGKLNTTTDDLEEKIKLLQEALEVALKMEEIQFFGVASQSTTLSNSYPASNCIDGSRINSLPCHSAGGDADPWWKLTFMNDVVINRITIYSESRTRYTAGNRVSILSAAGNIVWEHTIEKEEKRVYVIAVPNIVGQNVKIDKMVNKYVLMREVVVFGRYD